MKIPLLSPLYERLTSRQPHVDKNQEIADPENFNWDQSVDVVVAGFGGAGAATAIEAHDQGADVLVLDRFSGGGATTISGGIYYAGGGTRIQQEAGVDDTPENMFNYLKQEVQGAVTDATLKKFCDDSVDNFNWMEQNGVPFNANFCPYKTSYPPNQYYYYYSGNESFKPFSDHATPAARGHRGHEPGISGAAIYQPLKTSAEQKGIKIRCNTKVLNLYKDSGNRVIGLKALDIASVPFWSLVHKALYWMCIKLRYNAMYAPGLFQLFASLCEHVEHRFGRSINIRANKGVVLATGGFFSNQTMVKKYAPQFFGGAQLGTLSDDGSGITMALDLGADTGYMDKISAWRFINPPMAFVNGVLVGPSGQRICNEAYYGAQVADLMMKEHDGKAWLIIDSEIRKQALQGLNLKKAMWFQVLLGWFFIFGCSKKAESIRMLARKIGVSANALEQTIDTYNASAKLEVDEQMGKPAEYLHNMSKGPFYAVNVSYKHFLVPTPSLSLGGLKVNENSGLVVDTEGNDIQGLYAVGRTAVGIASQGYVSGLSIADCIFSGRRAGRHAAKITE